MLLSWIVLLIGFEIGIRTDTVIQLFPQAHLMKTRLICYLLGWFLAFLIYWMGLNSFFSWYFVMLSLVLLPLCKNLLKYVRQKQIPHRSLVFIDLILMNMKAGASMRRAILEINLTEKSWFTNFQLNLAKSIETGTFIETESDWFNKWGTDIFLIEKSRNKVIEHLELLRKYTRQEIHFKSRLSNAFAGPRAQIIVMSILFLCLNIIAIRNLSSFELKKLLPIAWFLFFLGLSVVFFIMRSFKWKV